MAAARISERLDVGNQQVTIGTRPQLSAGSTGHLGQRKGAGTFEEARVLHRITFTERARSGCALLADLSAWKRTRRALRLQQPSRRKTVRQQATAPARASYVHDGMRRRLRVGPERAL